MESKNERNGPEDEDWDEQTEDPDDDVIQDAYAAYRQTIGDYKMDAHHWSWKPERHAGFAAWLRALANRVESGK